MAGIITSQFPQPTQAGTMLRSLDNLASLLGDREAEIVRESWVMAEDIAFRKLVDIGIPKYAHRDSVNHYVCHELWMRWCMSLAITPFSQQESANQTSRLCLVRGQEFYGPHNPPLLLGSPAYHHTGYAIFHDDVSRHEYIYLQTTLTTPWHMLYTLGVGGVQMYQFDLTDVVHHIHSVEKLRLDLWNELRPHQKLYPGCGPWEVPLSGGERDLTCFALLQCGVVGLPNYRRAHTLLDDPRRIFIRCRQMKPGDKGSGFKLALVLSPVVKSLGLMERKSLLEAWEMIQSWYFCLCRGENVTLFDFFRNHRDEQVNALAQRRVEEVEDLGMPISDLGLSSPDLKQGDISKEEY